MAYFLIVLVIIIGAILGKFIAGQQLYTRGMIAGRLEGGRIPKLEISYDAGADVLYVSIGEPRPGIAVECNDGDFIRVALVTSEVVGITLLDFCERFIQCPPGNICSKLGENTMNDDDICGICGESGADKFPHPAHWPGEQIPNTKLVHSECEDEECKRAHAELSPEQRVAFLETIR